MKIKGLRYYTSRHPLFRNGLEVKFHFNGLPYLKESDCNITFSINRFFEWIELGYLTNRFSKKQFTISEIEAIVCEVTGINQDVVYAKTRKREIVTARQLIQHFAKLKEVGSLSFIGDNTGGYDHATIIHSYKTVNNLYEFNNEYRDMYETIKSKLLHHKKYVMKLKELS